MNIFIDVETIPVGDPVDPMTLTPPGNISKQETIDTWYRDKAPAIAQEKFLGRALDSMAGEILCIGYAVNDDPPCCLWSNEEEVLRAFEIKIGEIQGQWREPIKFIGWNINSFDIPWIWRKAIKYGLTTLRGSINRDRNRGNSLDLMLTWATDYKNYTKLDDVAKFLGLSGKVGDMDGSKVYDAYLEGRLDDIAAYCRQDIEIVRGVYRKIFE
jgi:DNA polymerase elongation subunit (family B)